MNCIEWGFNIIIYGIEENGPLCYLMPPIFIASLLECWRTALSPCCCKAFALISNCIVILYLDLGTGHSFISMKTCCSYYGFINTCQLIIQKEMCKAVSENIGICFKLRQTRNLSQGTRFIWEHSVSEGHTNFDMCT